MGMFDDLKCEFPLPDIPDPSKLEFQTKCFDCQLDTYTITAGGRLTVQRSRFHDSPPTEVKDTNFHGILYFYTHDPSRPGKTEHGLWVEYKAKFTDGQLQSVEMAQSHGMLAK